MGTRLSAFASEIEALKSAYAALNRGDVEGFIAAFAPQIERIEPSDVPNGGFYRGLAAVREHVAKARATWAEGGCEPEKFVIAPGNRIIVLTHVRVRLKSEIAWREGRTADVFTFRDGKAVEFRTFFDIPRAFEWVGINAPEAT